MTPYSSGNGCTPTPISANTTTVIGAVGASTASGAGLAVLAGYLHRIGLGGDSTATTVTVYDNTTAAGTPIAKLITQGNFNPLSYEINAQLKVGLTVVTSGMTSGVVTVSAA